MTPSVTHRRNIAVIKTFGGHPAACMGFYPTVNSRFAKTDGETLRAACILFADLTNSSFLPPAVYANARCTRFRFFHSASSLPGLRSLVWKNSAFLSFFPPRRNHDLAHRIRIALRPSPRRCRFPLDIACTTVSVSGPRRWNHRSPYPRRQ